MSDFDGFPGIGKGTVVPNLFFAAVLPEVRTPGALLAFLWASRLLQEKRGDTRFVTAAEIWAQPAADESFTNLAGGEKGLKAGLAECVELRALLAIGLRSRGNEEVLYASNDPASRRVIARARAGEISLRPDSIVVPVEPKERRPGIFRLYEENIGTITAMVGERLLQLGTGLRRIRQLPQHDRLRHGVRVAGCLSPRGGVRTLVIACGLSWVVAGRSGVRRRPGRAVVWHPASLDPADRRAERGQIGRCVVGHQNSTGTSAPSAGASTRGPTPSFSLIRFSNSSARSGLSFRKVRAFSLPWPSWSPS